MSRRFVTIELTPTLNSGEDQSAHLWVPVSVERAPFKDKVPARPTRSGPESARLSPTCHPVN